MWNDISTLWDAPVQPILGSEWKTWKHEVNKLFFTSPSFSRNKDMLQQQNSDDPLQASLQVCRKRPKLEVRRAEIHASQVETRGSDHSIALETDLGFFNNQNTVNTLAAETCKQEELREAPIPFDSSGNLANKWNDIVVESAADPEFLHSKAIESTPTNEMVGPRSVEPDSKNRQCAAFIESKGRQCVRWANDGDVYCCVHLSSRFIGSSARAEKPLSVDAPLCEGTTVLGTRCKHRALPGFSFCKKHRPHAEADHTPNLPQTSLKRKHEETYAVSENFCTDIVLADAGSPLQVDPVSAIDDDTFHGNSNLNGKPMHFGNDHNAMEELHCIGSSPSDDNNPCLETPKRYFLYCEKHLPSWLKRARNGKSRIISKEVYTELLRDCSLQEHKVNLHKACEIFYRLFKSILSLRNQVPKEVQFQWALTEASKDSNVRELFKKLVHSEKEKIKMIWGFNDDKDEPSLLEEIPQLPSTVNDSFGNENDIVCKICSAEFPDDQTLGSHWMENHKKESQWLFRGYACAICLDSFTNKKVLENHVQERHHVQFVEQCMLLQCIPCGSHFGNIDQLWMHVLSVHPVDFKASKVPKQQTLSTGEDSSIKLDAEQVNSASLENSLENSGGSRKFICRFCGLKFDLLPDLGRHHQAAHMGPNLVSGRPSKKGVRHYAYRLKSGRLSRPRLKKSLVSASLRIRNRASANLKRRIQATKPLGIEGTTVQPQVTEATNIGKLAEYQCSAVAKILFSEIQKTKPRPNNHDILSISRSACCKVGLQAALEEKFGTLPEKLYLKAAKLCSEHNILVSWHQEGFSCPRGCKLLNDQPLLPYLASLPDGFVKQKALNLSDPAVDEWEVDEFHYTINAHHLKPESMQKGVVLCNDISFGKESVPVICVVDQELQSSLHMCGSNEHDVNLSMPWKRFTYITKPMLDQSLNLDSEVAYGV